MPKNISEEAKDIINGMLKMKVEERLSIEDILKHPFLNEEPIRDINNKLETGDLISLKNENEDINSYLNFHSIDHEFQDKNLLAESEESKSLNYQKEHTETIRSKTKAQTHDSNLDNNVQQHPPQKSKKKLK